jgi:hypothetical protein
MRFPGESARIVALGLSLRVYRASGQLSPRRFAVDAYFLIRLKLILLDKGAKFRARFMSCYKLAPQGTDARQTTIIVSHSALGCAQTKAIPPMDRVPALSKTTKSAEYKPEESLWFIQEHAIHARTLPVFGHTDFSVP